MDVSVHQPGRGGDSRNYHAHLLRTTRGLEVEVTRRRREAVLQKSQKREGQEQEKPREKGQDKERDGPDFER